MATFPNVNDMNVQFPNRYRMKAPDDVGEGEVVDLVPAYGSVIDPGTPLDSSLFNGIKEYVDDISDSRNLLSSSGVAGTSSGPLLRRYTMTERMVHGETYTLRIWGSLGEGKTSFDAWLNGEKSLGYLLDHGDGTHTLTFTGEEDDLSYTDEVRIYALPNEVNVKSTITRIKLERGAVATDWTPAPEDPVDADTFGEQKSSDFMRYLPGNSPGKPIYNFDANTVDRLKPSMIPMYSGVNAPSKNSGVLETIPYTDDRAAQYFHEMNAEGGKLFRRTFYSETWSAWKKAPTSEDYVEKSSLLNMLYPVGSIYTTTSSAATCPIQSALGGTWVNYGGGRVLAGLDTTQTEFNSIGKTGGAKTHTLTTAEMPAHSHTAQYVPGYGTLTWGYQYTEAQANTSQPTPESGGIGYTGGNAAHNNLQPYIVVRHWRRTA